MRNVWVHVENSEFLVSGKNEHNLRCENGPISLENFWEGKDWSKKSQFDLLGEQKLY